MYLALCLQHPAKTDALEGRPHVRKTVWPRRGVANTQLVSVVVDLGGVSAPFVTSQRGRRGVNSKTTRFKIKKRKGRRCRSDRTKDGEVFQQETGSAQVSDSRITMETVQRGGVRGAEHDAEHGASAAVCRRCAADERGRLTRWEGRWAAALCQINGVWT